MPPDGACTVNRDDWLWMIGGAIMMFVVAVGIGVLWSAPVLATPFHQCGVASWYGSESGHRTANGERFPTGEATAAHRTLPFGTRVHVTDQATGRSVVVRVNDRGPAAWTGRIIDLSPTARRALSMGGLAKVCLSTGD